MSSAHSHWLGDAESKPAPEPLSRIQALVNTVELPDGPDRLGDPADAAPWLVDSGLLGSDADLRAEDSDTSEASARDYGRCWCTTRADRRRRRHALAPLRDVAADATARADFGDGGEILLTAAGDSVPPG